jgi:hypothetical protein
VIAPELSDGWEISSPLKLRLCQSSGRHIWGDFDFEIFTGTLRSETLSEPPSNAIKFHWRGRQSGTGESTFDVKNVMEICFLDETTFRGSMYWDCYGTFEIAGKVDVERTRNQVLKKNIRAWKDQYRMLNEANYSEECSSRWSGAFRQSVEPDPAAGSDTTVGVPSDEEDEEDEVDEVSAYRFLAAW